MCVYVRVSVCVLKCACACVCLSACVRPCERERECVRVYVCACRSVRVQRGRRDNQQNPTPTLSALRLGGLKKNPLVSRHHGCGADEADNEQTAEETKNALNAVKNTLQCVILSVLSLSLSLLAGVSRGHPKIRQP